SARTLGPISSRASTSASTTKGLRTSGARRGGPAFEHTRGRARVDRARSVVHARAQALDERALDRAVELAVGDDPRRGVEQHDVAHGTLLAREEPPRDL